MPSLYLMSLFHIQKAKYEERHAKAHQELDDFVAAVETQVGNEDVAKVFRAYLDIPWGFRLRGEGLPEIPPEGRTLIDEFLRLNHDEAVLVHKIRHSAFGYYEPLTPPHVFWCYGLDWHDIELMEEEGKLPVERVAELLEVLLDKQPRFPTAEESVSFHMDAGAGTWERRFAKKRRHLVWLLRTAVKLEEDLVCWI